MKIATISFGLDFGTSLEDGPNLGLSYVVYK